ncbi:MAG: type II toxin-antitoxin system Phd/YefM family antitoxin [Patescibacteria group bacterium]
MQKTVPIKQFRNDISSFADQVEESGKTFIVIRHSRPCFKVVPITDDEDGEWETVVDFTGGGKKAGIKAADFFKLLDQVNDDG